MPQADKHGRDTADTPVPKTDVVIIIVRRTLAVRNLEEFRGRSVGIRSSGWKQALQAFTIYFDGRIPTP